MDNTTLHTTSLTLHAKDQMCIKHLQVNTAVDNIGARRLHTVLERIVEDISFDAPDKVIDNALLAIWLAL